MMGLERDGIHDKINRYLGIHVEAEPLETAMLVHAGERTFTYYQNRHAFLREWERHLPERAGAIRAFFEEVWAFASILRRHMTTFPVLPPGNLLEAAAVLRGAGLKSPLLLPHLTSTLEKLLKKHHLQHESRFTEFLDGVLLDSMQTRYKDCSMLLACTALDIYHRGIWYVKGGLYRLIEEMTIRFQEDGGTLKKPRKITRLEPVPDGGWEAVDHRGNVYEAEQVVVNMPIKNVYDLLPAEMQPAAAARWKKEIDPERQWGAGVLYAAFKDIVPDHEPLFQQFLIDPEAPPVEDNHFFVSLSARGDTLRAPEGYRTMTVSTHIHIQRWNESQEAYDSRMAALRKNVTNRLNERWPGFIDAVEKLEQGGPRAWERFTQRASGGVGGFPQTPDQALWNAASHRTPFPDLYIAGDNVFPGAGSIAAASSGVHAARTITGRRIL
ncbi:NAD(P)/FAD-dependent oxidoreductase [Alkalicoccus chagannorensis]